MRDASLGRAVARARSLVNEAKWIYGPTKTIALFSGGDDSTALLHIVQDQIDAVAHISTGTGIPQTLDFVKETAAAFGVPLLVEETPPEVYEELVLEMGFPGPGMHFVFYCRLKERRLDDMKRRFCGRRGKGKILFLTGLRYSESSRRKMHTGASGPLQPAAHTPRIIFANPILDFTKEMLLDYRGAHDLPQNPVSSLIHMSGECLCGAFAKPDEMREIRFWFPDVAERFDALEARVRQAGKKYRRWGHGGGPADGASVGVLCQSCELPGIDIRLQSGVRDETTGIESQPKRV